jgi:hypothetical protein
MKGVGHFGVVWCMMASAVVVIGLVLATSERVGMARSLGYAALAVGVIWIFYYLWGRVFRSVYDDGFAAGRRRAERNRRSG